ncbi:tetratricopeptide repeat protein [Candidatus Pacearchaeota archaeon]|nr:tetratricopeptide repeat protein [Candidatus Pacearchaeota archaeon]
MNNSISACLIVKDEEKHIENCLQSLKNLAEEIVIVDTGSKDKTKKIAEKFTDSISDFEWNGNFSEARNLALSKATKDWILSIDADESFSEEDCNKIKKMLEREKEADGFLLNCRTYTNDMGIAGWESCKDDRYEESKKATGFYVSKLLRLFRNNKGFLFEGKIHETPHNSIKKAGGKVYDTDIIFHHFGALDKEKLRDKKETYINSLKDRLDKKDFSEKSEDYICFELGRELINLKRIEEAILYFERAISINEEFNYLLALGGLYLYKNELDKAEKILKRANEINPGNSSLNDNLGVIYAKKQEFNKAIRKFEKAIELNPKSADAHFNLGLVYRDKGKINKMHFYFERAVELNSSYKKKVEQFT